MGFPFISYINLDQQANFFWLKFQSLLGFLQSNALEDHAPPLSMKPLEDTQVTTDDQLTNANAREALESPCIQKLTTGPCGPQFSEALLCFLKSAKEEKGSDCVKSFVGLQKCILANPDAFKNKDHALERVKDKMNVTKPTQGYIFHPRYMVSEKKLKSKVRQMILPEGNASIR